LAFLNWVRKWRLREIERIDSSVKRIIKMKNTILAVIALAGLGMAGNASANTIVYDNQAGIPSSGIQDWGNNLGLVFYANKDITVKALGAFDNGDLANLAGADGKSGVTVQMYEITSWNPSANLAAGTATGTPVGNSVAFTLSSPGTQINGDAFAGDGMTLTAGHYYSIVAFNDINYNSQADPNPYTTENSIDNAISFKFYTLYDSGASGIAFPTTIDNWGGGGPTDRYAAGTFAIPDGGMTAGLLGGALIGLQALRRKLFCQ
jgi:hypothetical protein